MTETNFQTWQDKAWQATESDAKSLAIAACVLLLRDRVDALETALKRNAQDHLLLANATSKAVADQGKFFADLLGNTDVDEAELERRFRECRQIIDNAKRTPKNLPIRSSLVEQVAKAIYDAPSGHDGWYSEARAALRVVAEWLKDSPDLSGMAFGRALEAEAAK